MSLNFKRIGLFVVLIGVFFYFWSGKPLFAGITGKISGKVIASDKTELPGANIIIEGTSLGAASDINGNYYIINVPPGQYTVVCKMIGYANIRKTNVYVSTDLTTEINFELNPVVIEGETVTIVAERPVIQQDVAGSESVMREEDVQVFSQDAFGDFLSTQVGITMSADEDGSGISIRGGDISETNVVLNGMSLRNALTQQANLGISMTSIKEVTISSGGFTAEHGDIRSGLVNVITKEGSRNNYSVAMDLRYGPAQKKHFGPNPYSVNGPVWNVYCGPKAFEGVTEEDVANGNYAFPFLGWNNWAEQRLKDSDPDNDYTPQQWMELWRWRHRNIDYANKPDYILDGSIGGPVPLINATFLLSQHYENLQLAYPFSRKNSILSSTQGNVSFRLSPSAKLTWTNLYTLERGIATQEDNYSFGMVTGTAEGNVLARDIRWQMLYNPYGINPIERNTYYSGLNLSYALSPSTFYNISFSGSYYDTFQGVEKYRDTSLKYTIGNVEVDEGPEGFSYLRNQYDMFDQFWINGGGNQIDDSEYYQFRLKGLLESQITFRNQIKIGFETVYTLYNMRAAKVHQDVLYDGDYEPPYFLEGDVPMNTFYFENHPLQFAAFIQDKLEYSGMIANMGVRMDLFDPMTAAWDVETWNDEYTFENWKEDIDFTNEQKGGNALQYKISPRLGISFPSTPTSKFYFNYGHFYQLPTPERLFNIDLSGGSPPFTIPNLKADWPRTVSYEVGFEKAITESFLFRISGYYKDVTNQLSEQSWYDYGKNLLFETEANNNYEDIRGIELRLQQRQGRFGSGWIDFEYMATSEGWTGFAAVHENWQYEQEQRENAEQTRNWPVPQVRMVYSFRLPVGFGPVVANFKPLSDWALQINAYWRAGGKRIFDSSAPIWDRHYVERIDRHNVNLLLRKGFYLGDLNFSLYMRIRNATNFKGQIYPYSGEEYRNSLHLPWLQGDKKGNDKYGEGPSDEKPWINAGWQTWRQYINPRNVLFGLEINFK
ncbi:TonB-dependent receptor [candidate division KSB1 bacterium]|nr:TonB-dependent receptor [candidate division KSB1 bacterium]